MKNAIGRQASSAGSGEDTKAVKVGGLDGAIGGEREIAGESRGASGGPSEGSADRLSAAGAVVRSLARSVTGLLVDLIDRIVHGIRCMAPLVLGLGCQSTNEPPREAPAAHEPAPAPSPDKPKATGPRTLGQFTITFYYVIGEDEIPEAPVAANDNRSGTTGGTGTGDGEAELASITPDQVTLYAGGGKCEPIAEVSKEFAQQVAVQGTGKLRDGRVVNIWGACNCGHSPCFKVTPAQWGMAGSGKPLQPFRTVAVDPKVVKLGSLLYVPLLEGRTMPGRQPWGGYVHDGCVIADDTGGHIAGQRLDLFVGRKAYFLGLSGSQGRHAWARHVPVFDGTGICERKGREVGRKPASI